MGMFDTISVSGDLPFSQEMIDLGIDKNNLSFQTKDLDCTMSHYIIQNGELFEEKYKTEEWIAGDPTAKSIMDRIGFMERKGPYFDKVNFHGEIYFYEFLTNVQDKWDCWVEFKAVFTDGKLQKLELFKFDKTDNAERKARDAEMKEKIEKEQKRWINKYFFYTKFYRFLHYKIWINFWDMVERFASKMRCLYI
jgi:hypothetical protein